MRQHSLRAPLRAKRASLSLSINAIVIIVLAMTLLGLGLGFIRGLFKNITETTSTVQEQVKQQVLDDLRTGDKKLSFSTNSLTMESSSSQTVTIGVRNSQSTADELYFVIYVETLQYKDIGSNPLRIKCDRQDAELGIDMVDYEDPVYECEEKSDSGPVTYTSTDDAYKYSKITKLQFFYDMGPASGYSLSPDEAEVFPIRLSSSAGTKGTYLVKISILSNDPEDLDSPFGEKDDTKNEVYAEKTFFITVS